MRVSIVADFLYCISKQLVLYMLSLRSVSLWVHCLYLA